MEFTPYRLSPWAYARRLVALGLSDAVSGTNWVARMARPRPPRVERPRWLLQSLRHHPRRVRGRFPIVFFCSGVGNYADGGVWVNRLADHFAGSCPEHTLLIEDSDNLRFHRPRRFPHVAYHDGILIHAFAHGRLVPPPARDLRAIDDLVAELRRLLGGELAHAFFDQVRAKLVKSAAQAPVWRREYLTLLDRLAPRLVLVEDGCYGLRSHIIRWARERGIATAEYQHGIVSPSHDAYNVDPSLAAGAYANNFPEHFLSYGRWWSRQISIPSRNVIVGNPHLTELARSVSRRDLRRKVLFVSASIDVAMYRRFLAGMAASLPDDVQLVFRPHPLERSALGAYGDTFEHYRITVDVEPLAYQSVVDADLVVGDVSTLLFEAVQFGKPVVLLDHAESRKHIGTELFPLVSDPAQVAEHLAGRAAAAGVGGDDVWAPGWRDNYRRFLAEVGADCD